MANKNMQFISSTTKDGFYIKGTDNLYVFQLTTGTAENPRQAFLNYLYEKNGMQERVSESTTKSTAGESFWAIIQKPEDMEFADFAEGVKNNEYPYIAGTPIIPTGLDYSQVDMNGNILLASINSHLENEDRVGNILINADGEVIRSPKPSVLIREADERTGFYLIEVYDYQVDKVTGKKRPVAKSYNFLDPKGKILANDYDFELKFGEEEIIEVPRNFYMKNGKKVYNDWEVYSEAYVYCGGRQPELYLSAIDLVIENRERVNKGIAPLIDDERPYLEAYFVRKEKLENLFKVLSDRLDNGTITPLMYDKMMKELDKECTRNEYFEDNFKTPDDERIETNVLGEKENM